MTRKRKNPRRPLTDDEIRAGYRELVERKLLVVTRHDSDPAEAEYAIRDLAGAEKTLIDLAALGVATL